MIGNSFTEMQDWSYSQLTRYRDELRAGVAERIRDRQRLMGEILFLQKEIERYDRDEHPQTP